MKKIIITLIILSIAIFTACEDQNTQTGQKEVKKKNIYEIKKNIKIKNDPELNEKLVNAVENTKLVNLIKLINEGADPKAKDGFDNPIIFKAVENGNLQIVKLLITAGADIKARESMNQDNLCHHILRIGNTNEEHIKIIKYLIDKGLDVNALNKDKEKPLDNFTTIPNNNEIAKIVVEAGGTQSK